LVKGRVVSKIELGWPEGRDGPDRAEHRDEPTQSKVERAGPSPRSSQPR